MSAVTHHPQRTETDEWYPIGDDIADGTLWYFPKLDETAPGFSYEVLIYGYWVDGPTHRPKGCFTSGYRSPLGTWETHIKVIGYWFVPLMWRYFPSPPCDLLSPADMKQGRSHIYTSEVHTELYDKEQG